MTVSQGASQRHSIRCFIYLLINEYKAYLFRWENSAGDLLDESEEERYEEFSFSLAAVGESLHGFAEKKAHVQIVHILIGVH